MAKKTKLANVIPEEEAMVLEDERIKEPKKYVLVFHNDDFTTQEFVVFILMGFLRKNYEEAHELMLKVHREGKARVGFFTKDIALSKVQAIMLCCRQNEMPLKVTTEPA